MKSCIARVLGGFLVIALLAVAPAARAESPVLVFAAASLKGVLDEIAADWVMDGGAVISAAGSATLARQIVRGAPADLFLSANVAWMDVLGRKGLVEPGTRRDLLRNRLVLIAHGRNGALVEPVDLPALLGENRLAMALVDAAPAGIYGKAALTTLGVWPALAPKVAQTDNVRAALALVARGEAPFGIVYATDLAAAKSVFLAARFAADSHPPIIYPAAVMAESPRKARARAFLEYLASPDAAALFRRHGFGVIGTGGD